LSALEKFRAVTECNYIGGTFAKGVPSTVVVDPATEAVLGHLAEPDVRTIDAAVRLANDAQRGWWHMGASDRAEKLHQVGRKLRDLAALIGESMSREMGKPFREAVWEPGAAANAFDYYAELAKHDCGRIAGPAVAGQLNMVLKEPLGVVICIVPYNFPILLLAWQAAAALAAGNSVIIKPSDLTSLTTLIAMNAFDHLPSGLVQVLTGGSAVGRHLVGHHRTHGVAFTGTVANGQAVARSCAETFKPALIEASGNDPFIVMPSAPIETVIRGAAYAAFLNCGQVCTSAERFYVHHSVHDAFVAGLSQIAKRLRIGRGLDPVDMGPLAARRERDRYEPLIERAIQQGARVVAGGGRPSHLNRGWFVEPTVLADVTSDMEIVNNEPFGPVAPVVRVKNLDEAITLANRSRFGLGANIYTCDLKEAMRAVQEIDAGIVWVNTPLNDNDAVPFGGRKLSGIGRELGSEGIEQFRQSKMVMIAPEAHSSSEWFPYPDDTPFTGQKD